MLWERKNNGFEGNREIGERSCREQQTCRVPGMVLQEEEESSSACPQLPDQNIRAATPAAPRAQAAVPLLAFPVPGKGLLRAGVSHKHHHPSPALWHCLHKWSCGLAWQVIKQPLVHGLYLSMACKPSDPLTTCCSLGF